MSNELKICNDCGEMTQLFDGAEIKEPKLCIICYAAMVGFSYNKEDDTFHVIDDDLHDL